ncbi:MAG: hypothetical protein ACRCWQ_14445 [Bacilli bacterium]
MSQLPFVLRNEWIMLLANKRTLIFSLVVPWFVGIGYELQLFIVYISLIVVMYSVTNKIEGSKGESFYELLPVKPEVKSAANSLVIFTWWTYILAVTYLVSSNDYLTQWLAPHMFSMTILASAVHVSVVSVLNPIIGVKRTNVAGLLVYLVSSILIPFLNKQIFLNNQMFGDTEVHWILEIPVTLGVSVGLLLCSFAVSYFVVKKTG